MMKKIGITGAGGNIGTTLTSGLSAHYQLVLYDIKPSTGTSKSSWVKTDCANRDTLKGQFDGLDCLIHLAANPNPDAPSQQTLRNNFLATSFVFEEARLSGIKKIVFASSNFYHQGSITDALRGRLAGLITLDTPPTPRCLYADSKVFGENVGRHLSHLGMQFVALRIGWTVPDDNPALYGGDYMRAVFCSKRDLVEAFLKAIEIDADFLTAYAVSNNSHGVFDLSETARKIGFKPQDNADDYF